MKSCPHLTDDSLRFWMWGDDEIEMCLDCALSLSPFYSLLYRGNPDFPRPWDLPASNLSNRAVRNFPG